MKEKFRLLQNSFPIILRVSNLNRFNNSENIIVLINVEEEL